MLINDLRPLLAVAWPMIACLLILFVGEKQVNIRESFSVGAAVCSAVTVFSMVPGVLAGNEYVYVLANLTDKVDFVLKTDAAGILFACVSSFLYIAVSFYAVGYMRGHHEKDQTGFYAFFAVCICSALGIALAGNLLTFFVFFEMLTMATWPLVFHERNEDAKFSGRKYLIYTLVPGQLLLAGIVMLYGLTDGNLDFVPGGIVDVNSASAGFLVVLFFLLIGGGAVKAGMMPLHGWLPSAMVAPTPVSALLHAVAVVKAGAFCVIRVIGYVFGPEVLKEIGAIRILEVFAIFTILAASLIAMKQDNLKRRLAYSTVSQLSYVILGACSLSEIGFTASLYHIVAHALMKITLFMCAGAIIVTAHKDNISDMKGIGRAMPVTMGCYTVGAFGIVGLPGVVGFISKWNLLLGALQAGKLYHVVVLILSAMLGVMYLLPITYIAFFKKNEKGDFKVRKEADPRMLIPICVTAALSLLLGFVPDIGPHLLSLAEMAAQAIMH